MKTAPLHHCTTAPRIAIALFSLIVVFGSCSKEEPKPFFVDSDKLPPIVDTRRDYSMEALLDLADYFEREALTKHQTASLTPADFKYAVETKVNRDLRAGTVPARNTQSHPMLFDYTLDASGKIDGAQFDAFYAQIISHVDYLETLGAEFYMVDVEVVQGNRMMADVITAVGYVNTDLEFGFILLPENQTYQVMQDPFEDLVNDRLIFEAIDPDEFFFTDIFPNPSVNAIGFSVGAYTALGLLPNSCTMYAGSLESWGGPELVYQNNNENVALSGSLTNEYLLRGINYIEDQVPSWPGLQLIRLEFGRLHNVYWATGCAPGACSNFYPCFEYSHYWHKGYAARKMAVSK